MPTMDKNESVSEMLSPDEKSNSEETVALKFSFKPIKEKPNRKYRKGSKYDTILDSFVDSGEKLVEVKIEKKDANYIRTQLNKRIEVRKLKVKISVVNNVCYLEKK